MTSKTNLDAPAKSLDYSIQEDCTDNTLTFSKDFSHKMSEKVPKINRTIDNGRVQMGAGCRIGRLYNACLR